MTRFLVTGGNGFIGTNLVQSIRQSIEGHYSLSIIDLDSPKIELAAHETWYSVDILDASAVAAVFEKVKPEIVVHLAALTSTEPEYVMEDYSVNTKGSEIIYDCCEKSGIDFLVHTSTQFVNQAAGYPSSDFDYAPHTIYGESKVISEQSLVNGNYHFNWCIIRPTNIWGPWHLRYPYEFWKVLRDGKYFHPGSKSVIRSYGYVGNICWQILELIKRRNEAAIKKNVFYVGDAPMNMYQWANAFSLAINQKNVRVVPGAYVYALAVVGSLLRKIKVKFPITLSRYQSMTTDNPAPMDKTLHVLGKAPHSLEEGVQITVDWLIPFWKSLEQPPKL